MKFLFSKMIIKNYWIVFVCILISVTSLKAQYDETCFPDVGCFEPFYGFPPYSPNEIDISYLLYTRKNPEKAIKLSTIIPCQFPLKSKTTFIVHGYLSSGHSTWIKDMTAALLNKTDMNVIVVDWSSGAKGIYYQAASTTRVIGSLISLLIKKLQKTSRLDPNNVHIIGHSLGAHVAGSVGKRVEDIHRITGLDPAGVLFKDADTSQRLHKTDAQFVDVIHTNGGSFTSLGISKNIGHIDFYPNGGEEQPGCGEDPICSHSLSHDLMTASIKAGKSSDKFLATSCLSYRWFVAGFCDKNKKIPMGYFATHPQSKRTKFYLKIKLEILDIEKEKEETIGESIYNFFGSLFSKVYHYWNDAEEEQENKMKNFDAENCDDYFKN